MVLDVIYKQVLRIIQDIKLPRDEREIDLVVKNDLLFVRMSNKQIKGRKWYVSPHATDGEILQTILKAIITFEEHEIRERFEYKGRRIFGPHHAVSDLLTISEEYRVEE